MAIVAVLMVLAGSAAAIFFTQARAAGPIRFRNEALEVYSQSGQPKAFLSIQRNKDEYWGYLDAVESGTYGFFYGTAQRRGRLDMNMAAGNKNGKITLSRGLFGITAVLKLLREDGQAVAIRFKRLRPSFGLRLGIYENPDSKDVSSPHRIEIAQMESRLGNYGNILNLKLRRGEMPSDHALSLLREFNRGAEKIPLHAGTDTFMRRPYLLNSNGKYLSLAQETYLFQGGAHGITITAFDTLDMDSGRILGAQDFFNSGWEAVLPGLIEKEALRQLGSVAGLAKKATPTKLSDFGLFEDGLPLPSGIFPSAAGFGFHYNRYEIAPGAMGDFLFILPYSDLAGILRDEWMPEGAAK